jgi:uncharacterized membrane protein
MDKFKLSRNIGFITGPLMLILGIMNINSDKAPVWIAYMLIILGIIRIVATTISYLKSKKEKNEA